MASLATIFGSGAMTNSVREIEGMEVIFIIGSNTKEAHPVIANRMIKAHRRGTKIIVADPRRVPMVRFAELFLNLRPGTDVPLLNGMAHVIVKEGLHNEEFLRERTEGFTEWKDSVEDFTPEVVSQITGIEKNDIIRAARLYGSSRKSGIFYTMGITQHSCGTENVNAIANLALITGNIGREFTGINPLRGQNNVQGACDAGCLPNVLPGYQRVDLPEVRQKFEQAWGTKLPGAVGLKSTEMMPAAHSGALKALYVMGENPVLAEPNVNHTVEMLKGLEFLVVQDIFMTETAELAHVVLPSACFAEKDGTFTNTERRVQRVRKAVDPPGEARDDLCILMELSERLGYIMDYYSPEDVFSEFGELWPAVAGITYGRIQKKGIQWPCPTRNHPGTEYLYKGGFPRGKIYFTPTPYNRPAEVISNEYPFYLSTGRNLYHYHYGSMTGRVGPIEIHAGMAYAEIHPEDGKELGIAEGEMLLITSRRGSITVSARLTERVQRKTVFVPLHYHEAAVNLITNDALDAYAKTPEFKVCAVRVKKKESRK